MADIVREFEFCDLEGTASRSDLGKNRVTWEAYVDTGAGRTVCSTRVAQSIRMIPVPVSIEYSVPIRARSKAVWTAMRLLEDGCERFIPVLCAVSDEVIRALDLPGGLEVLVGQDYLQLARVNMQLGPKGEGDKLSCRPKGQSLFAAARRIR